MWYTGWEVVSVVNIPRKELCPLPWIGNRAICDAPLTVSMMPGWEKMIGSGFKTFERVSCWEVGSFRGWGGLSDDVMHPLQAQNQGSWIE